jgi:hypothetical protein
MPLTELYRIQDERLHKIKGLLENSIFFRYEVLSQEKINSLAALLNNNARRKQKSAGLLEKPAADFGARTATQNHTQGGDILHDVV